MRIAAGGRPLSPRDARAIRAGLRVAVPILLYATAARPYAAATRRVVDALRDQNALLQREEGVVSSAPSVRANARDADALSRRTAARLYAAADTALAIAAFGRDVTDAFRAAGLVIQHVELRDSVRSRAGLQELGIELRAQGDFGQVLHALARLEANPRLMRVARLTIERAQASGESLSVGAVVHGYAK